MVQKFSAVRFLPFLAHMGPFLVIFLVLRGVAQGGSLAQNMPLGPLETGEQKKKKKHDSYNFPVSILKVF